MRLPLLLCLVMACPVSAQFASLATTADGTQVFFTTSLRQPGTDQTFDPKLFRLDDGGPALLFTRATCDVPKLRGPCGIGRIQTAANGSILSYQGSFPCLGGSSCSFRELNTSILVTPTSSTYYPGFIALSRNGRYLVNWPTGGPPGLLYPKTFLYDLHAGDRKDLGYLGAVTRVTNTGTILAGGLITPESQIALPLPGRARDMDESASIVVSEKTTESPTRVTTAFVTKLPSGTTWQIGPPERDSFDPHLSADGEWVLYTSHSGDWPELFFSRIDNTEWRQLTDGGVQSAVLSDDGRTAWALTTNGALLRIETRSGVSTEIVENTPHSLKFTGGPVPGSANTLSGVALTSGLPARLTLDETDLPLLQVSPTQIEFQIPWNLQAPAQMTFRLPNTSRTFEAAFPFNLYPVQPVHHSVLHQDFVSEVTLESPARPGEIVHIYVTGLGPVQPPVTTGVITPADPPSLATLDFSFSLNNVPGPPAEILFVGLAPGLTGIYRVDFRIPTQLPDNRAFVRLYVSYTYPENAIKHNSMFPSIPVAQP